MSQVSKMLSSLDDKDAIDAVKFLGDVGDTDAQILDRILSHCTLGQLMHIEKSSKGRDLTPITNKLWKNFYEKKFGKDATNNMIEIKTMQLKESVTWRQLYEEKVKRIEVKARAIVNRAVQNYHKENARKESHKVKFYDVLSSSTGRKRNFECTVSTITAKRKVPAEKGTRDVVQFCNVPPSSMIKKRKVEFYPNKGRLMEKSKADMHKSIEMKNYVAYQRSRMQKC